MASPGLSDSNHDCQLVAFELTYDSAIFSSSCIALACGPCPRLRQLPSASASASQQSPPARRSTAAVKVISSSRLRHATQAAILTLITFLLSSSSIAIASTTVGVQLFESAQTTIVTEGNPAAVSFSDYVTRTLLLDARYEEITVNNNTSSIGGSSSTSTTNDSIFTSNFLSVIVGSSNNSNSSSSSSSNAIGNSLSSSSSGASNKFDGSAPSNINHTLFEVDDDDDDNDSTENDDEFELPPAQAIVVSVILLFVIIGTVVGNVLVCIAVCMVRKLRRPCNYLLVSLALSDLCVAVLVMPMALLYEVLEKWNFGRLLCDIWVSFDVLCCTASILNLCAISVDRYLAITKPLEYGVKRTPRRMMLCVALVWLAAACISLPPLLILGNEHVGENGEPVCTVCQNFAYQIYATLGSFYIPLSVMLFVYYQIFRAAHRIVLEEKRAQTHLQHALNGTSGSTATQQAAGAGITQLPGSGSGSGNGQQRHSSCGNTSLTYSTCGVLSAHGGSGSGVGGMSGSSNLLGSPHQKKIRFQLAKEKKASTTLGIIMSAFTICWLPFFILALIRPFFESETTHVPQSLSSLFLWLGYANSLLNPIIYATLNRDFRKPFQAILYFRCSSLNTMMRENYYQDQYGEPPSQRVMLGDERHGARESFL